MHSYKYTHTARGMEGLIKAKVWNSLNLRGIYRGSCDFFVSYVSVRNKNQTCFNVRGEAGKGGKLENTEGNKCLKRGESQGWFVSVEYACLRHERNT